MVSEFQSLNCERNIPRKRNLLMLSCRKMFLFLKLSAHDHYNLIFLSASLSIVPCRCSYTLGDLFLLISLLLIFIIYYYFFFLANFVLIFKTILIFNFIIVKILIFQFLLRIFFLFTNMSIGFFHS